MGNGDREEETGRTEEQRHHRARQPSVRNTSPAPRLVSPVAARARMEDKSGWGGGAMHCGGFEELEEDATGVGAGETRGLLLESGCWSGGGEWERGRFGFEFVVAAMVARGAMGTSGASPTSASSSSPSGSPPTTRHAPAGSSLTTLMTPGVPA